MPEKHLPTSGSPDVSYSTSGIGDLPEVALGSAPLLEPEGNFDLYESFEDGTLDGWTVTGNGFSVVEGPAKHGNNSLRHDGVEQAEATISFPENRRTTASCWFKAGATSRVQVQFGSNVGLDVRNADGVIHYRREDSWQYDWYDSQFYDFYPDWFQMRFRAVSYSRNEYIFELWRADGTQVADWYRVFTGVDALTPLTIRVFAGDPVYIDDIRVPGPVGF